MGACNPDVAAQTCGYHSHVIRYAKIGYRIAGAAAVVVPIVRSSWAQRRDPEMAALRTDPSDTLEALEYWMTRRRSLPVYRIGARREADRMISTWQGRVIQDVSHDPRSALLSGRMVSVSGGLVRYHAGRWMVRTTRGSMLVAGVLVLAVWLIAR
jgi:hypothetical protein